MIETRRAHGAMTRPAASIEAHRALARDIQAESMALRAELAEAVEAGIPLDALRRRIDALERRVCAITIQIGSRQGGSA